MSTLLFPGRHLVNTRFQEDYLRRVLSENPKEMPGLLPGRAIPEGKVDRLIFAITSSNQANSRYNPVPFYIRAVAVDRFVHDLAMEISHRIFGIPHYGHIDSFADFTVKEIRDQSEGLLRLDPANCLVLCSTPEVIALYQALGYSMLTAEQTSPDTPTPIDLVQSLADAGEDWELNPKLQSHLAPSSFSVFRDFPEIPRRIIRLYRDPLTNQEGSLTEGRNYNSYARGMNEIMRLKYLDIAAAIKPGRIVDEGCSDGGLLAEIAQGFPDSDLYGIDLSAEFAHRFEERRRAGEFGGSYAHFFLRNLLDPLFDPESIDTTLCNSTLHELWSYADGEKTVRAYLAEKFRQLRPGGRLIIRDVVGPEDGEQEVLLWCNANDGKSDGPENGNRSQAFLESLSTLGRFHLFFADFLRDRPRRRVLIPEEPQTVFSPDIFRVPLRLAAEFLSKKDYTDNWVSEMNEEFCFWSFPQWKQALLDAGFEVIEREISEQRLSRAYCNPWIVQNRFENKVRLSTLDDRPMNFPPTNMVLVAEKPQN